MDDDDVVWTPMVQRRAKAVLFNRVIFADLCGANSRGKGRLYTRSKYDQFSNELGKLLLLVENTSTINPAVLKTR